MGHKGGQSLLSTDFQDALSAAKASVSNICSSTFKTKAQFTFLSCRLLEYYSRIVKLTVQNKFLDIVTLEQEYPL